MIAIVGLSTCLNTLHSSQRSTPVRSPEEGGRTRQSQDVLRAREPLANVDELVDRKDPSRLQECAS